MRRKFSLIKDHFFSSILGGSLSKDSSLSVICCKLQLSSPEQNQDLHLAIETSSRKLFFIDLSLTSIQDVTRHSFI